jgi:hypothetical protein
MRTNRDEWRRRVERWAKSGKSAEELAAVRHWKYRLRREDRRRGRTNYETEDAVRPRRPVRPAHVPRRGPRGGSLSRRSSDGRPSSARFHCHENHTAGATGSRWTRKPRRLSRATMLFLPAMATARSR